ncbi:MAG: ATP-binding cassette domain-containing protein, partial [Hyphomicrobiales bacterium]|nr:ATP-binding cassette domain-containing protein [Hyphomicrobiales bacterium]
MPALLAAENVGCRARGKQILDDVSLAIEARDFVTLIGPNGAGKTQLIKILLGILPPSEGKVVRQPGVRIGYMPQDFVPSVALPLTVRRFVQLNHARTAATKAAMEAAVEATGIQPLLNALLSDLSGGERQLVLLARALSGDPQILILDEPAQNLDLAAQQNLYRLVQDL